jgi:CheY-like chemotaxis protein
LYGCGIAGGLLVPKILVADDNSNIQKMVVLALKDQGIEVVAVGNGEAAVRKISDIKPDLVLADVFMPVRNGYEVCEYVKTDATLSHIPVILLVGAFDPLDEQEAQRVGADGVLKKPFVPPDPLISMVKSALARAGVLAAKAPEPEPVRATDFLEPRVPAMAGAPAPAALPEMPIAAAENESFVEEVPGRPEPVKIDGGTQPVAFGSLLDTSTQEAEEDAAFLPPANSALAMERDWRDKDTEEDAEEEEEETTSSWRHEETETVADVESKAAKKGRRSGGFEPTLTGTMPAEAWESGSEKPEVQEVSARVQEAPAAATAIHEVKTEIPAAPFASDAWAAVVASGGEKKSPEETVTALEEAVHTPSQEQSIPEPVASSAPEVTQAEAEKKPSSTAWFSSAPSPWDSEIQKANRLASAWDSGVPAPVATESTNGTGKVVELPAASEAVQAAIEEAALPAAAVEAIREEAAQVAEDAVQAAAQPASAATAVSAPEENEPSMDDMVAKVLAKMSPDVLQAVTREILKPVIEAMVKEEMKSKKS